MARPVTSGAPPLIGVTGHRRFGTEIQGMPPFIAHEPLDVTIAAYPQSVSRAGGLPVLLTRDADPVAVVERLDGLLLSGGEDVDPQRYDAAPSERSTRLDLGRDEQEVALFEAAVARGIPVLGICRGCQLINVACGGTLIPDLPSDSGEAHGFHGYPGPHRRHNVDIAEGTELFTLLGRSARVNSYHHQAVASPGTGVVITARAEDGIAEAIEVPGKRALAVQWHPEMFSGDPVFTWLVDQARRTTVEDEVFSAIGN